MNKVKRIMFGDMWKQPQQSGLKRLEKEGTTLKGTSYSVPLMLIRHFLNSKLCRIKV